MGSENTYTNSPEKVTKEKPYKRNVGTIRKEFHIQDKNQIKEQSFRTK